MKNEKTAALTASAAPENTEKQNETMKNVKSGLLQKFRQFSLKKIRYDSMFSFEKEKTEWTLSNDASCMGYVVFLKKEYINNLNFVDEQKAQVWMNTFFV